MWYLIWVLGIATAVLLTIVHALWFEARGTDSTDSQS